MNSSTITALLVTDAHIVLGRRDGSLKIVSKMTEEEVIEKVAHGGSIQALRQTENGFASASSDGSVALWEFDGRPKRRFRLAGDHLNDAVILKSGAVIVASVRGTVARIDPGRQWKARGIHGQAAFALAASPDETLVASSGYDGMIRIWSVDDGKEITHWQAHDKYAKVLAWQESTLWSGGFPGKIKRWSSDGQPSGPDISIPTKLPTRMSVYGEFAAVAGVNQNIFIIKADTAGISHTLKTKSGPVYGLQIMNRTLFSGLAADQIARWNVTNGQVTSTVPPKD